MTCTPDIRIAPDGPEWAERASELILPISEAAIRTRGRFLIALSGGSTPNTLYRAWAASGWRSRFDWSRVLFVFGDERCVSPNHSESNFGMAQRTLFSPLGIRPAQILRMEGEREDCIAAARDYEQRIRLATDCSGPDFPQLDLVLLGLGNDGHTASLFPSTAALQDQTHVVTVGQAPAGIVNRLTLTLGVINRATVVLFLVAGASKAPVVRAVLEPAGPAERALPAAMVQPVSGRLIWMLDQAAAAQLTGGRRPEHS